MKRIVPSLVALFLMLGVVGLAFANDVDISVTYRPLTGTTWEYNYTVTNNSLAFNNVPVTVDWFRVWFTANQYANLSCDPSVKTDWGPPLAVSPSPLMSTDGFYDAEKLIFIQGTATPAPGTGIRQGASELGFLVSFDWIGTGTTPLTQQYFEVYDTVLTVPGPLGCQGEGCVFNGPLVLASGMTSVPVEAPVPLPASILLFGSGAIGTIGIRSFRKKKNCRRVATAIDTSSPVITGE